MAIIGSKQINKLKESSKKYNKWLDNLAQESWQLELILSSVVLVIIASLDSDLRAIIEKYPNNISIIIAFKFLITIFLFIKSNLVIHICIRGSVSYTHLTLPTKA